MTIKNEQSRPRFLIIAAPPLPCDFRKVDNQPPRLLDQIFEATDFNYSERLLGMLDPFESIFTIPLRTESQRCLLHDCSPEKVNCDSSNEK